MNKFCVIAKNKETYFIKRLIEEVGKNSVEFFDPWSDFLLPEAEFYLARTSGVYHSDLDLMIMGSIVKKSLINPLDALKRFRSKNSQYQWMEEEGYSCLPWLSLKDANILDVEKFFRLYPFMVVKPLVGQGGWGIEVLTWPDFKSWWKKKSGAKDQDYLIQPLIKEGREFRYFFVKGQRPIVLERKSKTGIAANFKKQGDAQVSFLEPVFQQELEKMSEASGASYGAIDLIIKDGVMNILELNVVPGIEQVEKVSGENIMKIILLDLK